MNKYPCNCSIYCNTCLCVHITTSSMSTREIKFLYNILYLQIVYMVAGCVFAERFANVFHISRLNVFVKSCRMHLYISILSILYGCDTSRTFTFYVMLCLFLLPTPTIANAAAFRMLMMMHGEHYVHCYIVLCLVSQIYVYKAGSRICEYLTCKH